MIDFLCLSMCGAENVAITFDSGRAEDLLSDVMAAEDVQLADYWLRTTELTGDLFCVEYLRTP